MKKRMLAILMALALIVSLLPAGVLAAPYEGEAAAGREDSPITASENNVNISKYLSGTAEEGYKLTLEAFASNMATTTTTTTPLDIVLVLDVSGSMDDPISTKEYDRTYKTSWSFSEIYRQRTTYYHLAEDGNYYTVRAVRDNDNNYALVYGDDLSSATQLGKTGSNRNEELYNGYLYTLNSSSQPRIDALQTAVNGFIDDIAENARTNDIDHKISLVKFAGNKSNEVGNDTYEEYGFFWYAEYNYSQIVTTLTSVNSESEVTRLKEIVNSLEPMGATRADHGMEHAGTVLESAGRNSKKVVIMFTDGEPTSGDSFEDSVANGAITAAKSLKDDGVTVYTIGLFNGANPDGNSSSNKYMNGVSSNYPEATSYNNLGSRATGNYYFAADSAGSLEQVFEGIADSVTTGTLDDYDFTESTFTDTLSQYFDFPARLNGNSDDITVQYAGATDYNAESGFIFGTPGDLPSDVNVTVNVDSAASTISVSGFDYGEHAATYNSTTGDVSGGKLVITFPIELDEAACVNDPKVDDQYPTNSELELSYMVSGENKSTSTNQTPYVEYDVDTYDANGTDITVQVYVDGTLETNPLSFVTISRNTTDTDYNYFKLKSNSDGTLTYDFNYDTYDCVDIDVALANGASGRIVQGIEYREDVGSGEPKGVQANASGYTIDNVTAGDTDPDVKIYLRTVYSVEYHKDSNKLTDATYTDSNTYIAAEDVTDEQVTGSGTPAENAPAMIYWNNEGYLTSITLPTLPAPDEGKVVEGWFNGTSTDKLSGSVNVAKYVPSTGTTIVFNATQKDNTGNVIINFQDEEGTSIKDAVTSTGTVGEAYSFTVGVNDTDTIPFTIVSGETNYVFDHFAEGSAVLSGDYAENDQTITAVYKVDENNNGVPDDYEATVTYKVVNGTWDGEDSADKTATFKTKEFNSTSNTWDDITPAPTLDDQSNAIPTGMTANEGFTGGSWDTTPTGDTTVAGDATYTYTFTGITPTITVTVTNGTATADGMNEGQPTDSGSFTVTYNADATINFIANEGYTLDTVTVNDEAGVLTDGSYTFNDIKADQEIKVVFAADDNDDNTPDYKQVFFVYEAGEGGSVNPTTAVATLNANAEGEYAADNYNVPTSTATASDGYHFVNWTYNGTAVGTDAALSYAMSVEGGKTYTFTANFEAKTYGLDVEKTLVSVGNTQIEEGTEIPNANVGEKIIWNITVTNSGNQSLSSITVTDNMVNASGTVVLTGTDDTRVNIDGTKATISELEPEDSVVITATYTVLANDVSKTLNNSVNVADKGGHDDEDTPDEGVTVSDYSVKITPADIIAYTGGTAYGAIVNESGTVIGTTTSGLPEPGYHIVLSRDANDWLTMQTGNFDADDLSNIIKFTYGVDGVSRVWELEYMGVYSVNPTTGNPSAYVYKLNTVEGEYDVRLQYKDGEHTYIDSDDIPMTADSVNKQYTMSIYPGDLNQGLIKATLTVNDESISANVKTGTGTLTVLSTVTDGNTTTKIDAAPDPDNMVARENGSIKYFVNESQVEVAKDRVELLVDNISNSAEFNESVGEDAMSWLEENYDADFNDAGYEVIYFDLVDTANGNAKVSFTGGNLTIYWPVPEDNEGEDFYVVHYTGMDRTETDPSTDVAAEAKELHATDVVTVDGEDYVVFNVSSFSPFVLVYDTDDGWTPKPDDDDDTVYIPNWLNTTDHYAYIVGYEDGTIRPQNNITRAEVATIFFRLLTDNARERYWSTTNDFSDIAAESWYNNAISTLSNMGIINGYEDGTFKPNAPITRAEFTAIATRFFDYEAEYDGAFNDVSARAWYADYVQAAVDMGLVDGYPDGGFHPDAYITRAEACTIVNRVLHRVPHEDHLLAESVMNTWPDNPKSAWYYEDMQEATNSHDYDWIRDDGETVEDWTKKLPERDWSALETEWATAYSR